MVFCYQNCSDLLWEKNVLVIEKNFWNSRLMAENLQRSLGCEIFVISLLSFCQNERFLSFLSLYIFEVTVFIFQFLNDKMHNYVKHNITVNFIIQKLKNEKNPQKVYKLRKLRNLSARELSFLSLYTFLRMCVYFSKIEK